MSQDLLSQRDELKKEIEERDAKIANLKSRIEELEKV